MADNNCGFRLRDYQGDISEKAVSLLARHGMCYLAMECRTGKTLTALATADRHGAKSVLVLTKKKAIPSILSDYDTLKPGYALEVGNYESAHKFTGAYDIVILDEAHSLGAFPKPSQRTKAVKQICKGKPIIYLSGTPSPESFSQLYHQMWVSSRSPFAQYPNFYKWAKQYVRVKQRMIGGHMVNDYSDADKDKIDRAIGHLFIDYSQEQAGFDARIEEHIVTLPSSAWTRQAIRAIKRDRVISWTDDRYGRVDIVADTPAKLMTKLHQLSSGSVIDEEKHHIITDSSKAMGLRDLFRGKKIAMFYVYDTEREILEGVFPKHTSVPEVFQKSDDRELVFLAQVRSAREGVRLDTADALIFYNMEYSYLSYEQGRNRLSSKERTEPAQVYFACSDCGIEKDIMSAVMDKQDFTASYYKKKYGTF